MKHDSSHVAMTHIQIIDKQSLEHVNVKSDRKTLQVLQPGAGLDKENLVGGGRSLGHQSTSKDGLKPQKEVVDEKNLINEALHKKIGANTRKKQKTILQSVPKDKIKIAAEDLTSQESPSESYWCVLAEKRRLALEEALEENMKLHEKIALLEQEVETQKTILSETNEVISVLKELVTDVSDTSVTSSMSDGYDSNGVCIEDFNEDSVYVEDDFHEDDDL